MTEKLKNNEQLIQDIKAFISTPDLSGNDWPNISNEDMQTIHDLFTRIAEAKWGCDCDGDSPVTIISYYRRTHWLPWSYPIPLKTSIENKLRLLSGANKCYSNAMDNIICSDLREE